MVIDGSSSLAPALAQALPNVKVLEDFRHFKKNVMDVLKQVSDEPHRLFSQHILPLVNAATLDEFDETYERLYPSMPRALVRYLHANEGPAGRSVRQRLRGTNHTLSIASQSERIRAHRDRLRKKDAQMRGRAYVRVPMQRRVSVSVDSCMHLRRRFGLPTCDRSFVLTPRCVNEGVMIECVSLAARSQGGVTDLAWTQANESAHNVIKTAIGGPVNLETFVRRLYEFVVSVQARDLENALQGRGRWHRRRLLPADGTPFEPAPVCLVTLPPPALVHVSVIDVCMRVC